MKSVKATKQREAPTLVSALDGEGWLRGWLARPHSLTKPDTTAELLSLLGTVQEKKRFRVLFLCLCRCGFCRFGFVFWVVFWL